MYQKIVALNLYPCIILCMTYNLSHFMDQKIPDHYHRISSANYKDIELQTASTGSLTSAANVIRRIPFFL